MTLKVGIIPHLPLSIHTGGFERSAKTLHDALHVSGEVSAESVDWLSRKIHIDILHVFGGSSNWYDIAYHFPRDMKLVVTALAAQTPFGVVATIKSLALSWLNRLTHNRTVHDRAQFILKRADAIICLSDVEREFFHKRYNVEENRIHIIPNSVPVGWTENIEAAVAEARRFLPDYFQTSYILYIGTITKRKNPLHLLRACKILNLPILIIGRAVLGEEDYYLKVRSELDAYEKKGLYLQEVTYGSILHKGMLLSSSVVCLPSSLETQPLVLLEALALGCRTLSGNGSYSRQELLENTFKCNPNSIQSIVDTIKLALGTPRPSPLETIISHREAARRHIMLYKGLL